MQAVCMFNVFLCFLIKLLLLLLLLLEKKDFIRKSENLSLKQKNTILQTTKMCPPCSVYLRLQVFAQY